MAGTMLIGYDVEWWGEEDVTRRFLRQVRRMHDELGVPATLFIVGRTLERWVEDFREIASDPLFDLQQHTYSHKLLKTVYIEDGRSVRVVRGAGLDEIRCEVGRTSELLREHLGMECIGLTGPWCYYRGLRDRPDVLEVLWEEGIRFTRTDGRNERDWHPVSMDLQPYWYEPLGFPDMLEIPTHGWHDNTLRQEVLGWDDLDGYFEAVRPYIERAAERDEVFSLCQHDWSSVRDDPEMSATERLITHALERGVRIVTCREYYLERLRSRERRPEHVRMGV